MIARLRFQPRLGNDEVTLQDPVVSLPQFATGVLTVYLNCPLALAVIHNSGAALLLLLPVMLNYKIRIARSSPSPLT